MRDSELKPNGFDGLVAPTGECACVLGELRPCGEDWTDCSPAYLGPWMDTAYDFQLYEVQPTQDMWDVCKYLALDDPDSNKCSLCEPETAARCAKAIADSPSGERRK